MWYHHSTGNIYPTEVVTVLTIFKEEAISALAAGPILVEFQRKLRDAREVAFIDAPVLI